MRLETGGHHNLASLGPGDFFGELAFLDEGTRTADAVAETRVQPSKSSATPSIPFAGSILKPGL